MTQTSITYAAIAIAVIAIVIAGINMLDKPDMDDFVSVSQHQLVLQRVADLETRVSCDENDNCIENLSEKFASLKSINTLIDLMETEAELMVQFKGKIVANSDKIADNHPYDFEPEELPVESEVTVFSSLLEIQIEQETWIQGQDIVFTGKGLVNAGQIEITITEPLAEGAEERNERFLNAIVHNDGTWTFRYITDFNSQLGEYEVFVEQRNRISQTILFTVISGE